MIKGSNIIGKEGRQGAMEGRWEERREGGRKEGIKGGKGKEYR